MGHLSHPTGLSRRQLLKTVALSAAAMVVSPLPGRAASAQAAPLTPGLSRVGLLLPDPKVHSQAGASFTHGFQLGMGAAQSQPELVSLPTGDTPRSVLVAAQEMLARAEVDVAVTLTSPSAVRRLRPLFEEQGKRLVAADVGANLVSPADQSANASYATLGYWQANWSLGQWLARQGARRAFVAASLYESGYDSFAAFRLGFESGGGEVVSAKVTHVPGEEAELDGLISAIREAAPDCVCALYSGQQAREFLQAWASSGLAGRITLAGSPFLVDESLLAEGGDGALGVISCLSWAPDLPGDVNRAFVQAFRERTGRAPDTHAVLGFDTARALLGIPGLRGRAEILSETGNMEPPVYVREVRSGICGLYNHVIGAQQPIDTADPRLAALRSGVKTGWLNTYLHG